MISQKRHGSFFCSPKISFLRTVAIATCVFFLASDILSFPSTALANPRPSDHLVPGGNPTGYSLASATAFSGNVQEISVPSGLGFITETSLSKTPNGKYVVLIQDAHAVPDAQRSLRGLIEYFQDRYGIRQVALEGAEGRLDPGLFKNYPDKEKLAKIFGSYLAAGELSGAAAASVLSNYPAEYTGIEDWKLYQEGVETFLAGLKRRSEFDIKHASLVAELQELKDEHYSSKAMEFDQKFQAWEEDPSQFAAFLEYLAERRASLGVTSEKYPAVHSLMNALQQEKADLSPALDQEIKELALRAETLTRDKNAKARLSALKQDLRTGRIGKRKLAYRLMEFIEAEDINDSPELRVILETQEKLAGLNGPAFIQEFNRYLDEVKALIFISEKEKEVSALNDVVRLLEKLIKFELSREEWDRLQASDAFSGKTAVFRSETVVFEDFYKIALKRETSFNTKIQKLSGMQPVVLVTGGFHVQGLTEKFKEQGISYAVVSPVIHEIPQDSRYLNYMQGRVSWRDYFTARGGKVDLYDAFVRATIGRFFSHPTPAVARRFELKQWRDNIIRALAAQGRVTEHSKYTRYIDQALLEQSAPEMEALKAKWTEKFDQFIRKLQSLGQSNQLTQANITKLFQAPANQIPVAVASLVPGATLSQNNFEKISIPPQTVPMPEPATRDETTIEPGQRSEIRDDVVVESIIPEDVPELLKFREEYFVNRITSPLEDADWEEEFYKIANGMNPDPTMIFLAKEQGKIVGYVTATDFSAYEEKRGEGWLGEMAVHPDHEGKGLGAELFDWALHWLTDRETVHMIKFVDASTPILVDGQWESRVSKLAEKFEFESAPGEFHEWQLDLQRGSEEDEDGYFRSEVRAASSEYSYGKDLAVFQSLRSIKRKLEKDPDYATEENFEPFRRVLTGENKAYRSILSLSKKTDLLRVLACPILGLFFLGRAILPAFLSLWRREPEVSGLSFGINLGIAFGFIFIGSFLELAFSKDALFSAAKTKLNTKALRVLLLFAKHNPRFFRPKIIPLAWGQLKFKHWDHSRYSLGATTELFEFLNQEYGWEFSEKFISELIPVILKEDGLSFREFGLHILGQASDRYQPDEDAKKVLDFIQKRFWQIRKQQEARQIRGQVSFEDRKSKVENEGELWAEKVEPGQRSEVRSPSLEEYLKGKTLIYSVFQGGGAKGVAYVGALEELEDKNMWFKEIAGTSAGAITASLIAAGYTYPEIKDIVFGKDLNDFKDKRWGFVPPWLNFLFTGGMYRGKAFETWIAKKLKEKLTFEPTLKDLPIPLTVITSDITNQNMLVLNKETAPDLKVAEAVRMSMGIPFFFEVYKWFGFYKKFPLAVRRTVDGGLLSNFPLFIYDRAGEKGEPVVGFMLQEIPHKKKSTWVTKLLNLLKYLPAFHIAIAVIDTAMDGHDNRHIEDDDWARIVHIPVDVGTLDFDLTKAQKEELAARGKAATQKILDQALRGEKGKSRSEMRKDAPKTLTQAREKQIAEEIGIDQKPWLKKVFEKLFLKKADFRLLVHLLRIADMPPSHKTAYIIMGGLSGLSAPVVESSKVVLLPAILFAMPNLMGATVVFVLGLWLGSILRTALIVTPTWLVMKFVSKEPLQVTAAYHYNFIPFVGAYGAVLAQVVEIVRAEYKRYENMSWKRLRKINRKVSESLSEQWSSIPESFRPALELLSPAVTFAIVEFQKKNPTLWREHYSKVRSVKLGKLPESGEDLLMKKINRRVPTVFIGFDDADYEKLRQRILKRTPEVQFLPFFRFNTQLFWDAYFEVQKKEESGNFLKRIFQGRKAENGSQTKVYVPRKTPLLFDPEEVITPLFRDAAFVQDVPDALPGSEMRQVDSPWGRFEKRVSKRIARKQSSEAQEPVTDLTVVADGLRLALPHYFGSNLMVIRGNAQLLELSPGDKGHITMIEKTLKELAAKLEILQSGAVTVFRDQDGKNYVWLSDEGFSKEILRQQKPVAPKVWRGLKKQLGLGEIFSGMVSEVERIRSKIELPALTPADTAAILESSQSMSSLIRSLSEKTERLISGRSEVRDSIWNKSVQLRPKYVTVGVAGIVVAGALLGIKISGISRNELDYMTTAPVEVKRFINNASRTVRVTETRKVENDAEYVPMFTYRIKPRGTPLYTDGVRSCAALIIDDPSGGRHFLGHFGSTQSTESIQALITEHFPDLGGLQVYLLEGNQPGMDRNIFTFGAYATIKHIHIALKNLGLTPHTKYIPKNTNPYWGSRIFIQDGELFLPNRDADYAPLDDTGGTIQWTIEPSPRSVPTSNKPVRLRQDPDDPVRSAPALNAQAPLREKPDAFSRSEMRQGEFSELLSQVPVDRVTKEEKIERERVAQWKRAFEEIVESNFYDKTAEPLIAAWEQILHDPDTWTILGGSDKLDPLFDWIERGHSPKAMRMPSLTKSAVLFGTLGLLMSALFESETASILIRGLAIFALTQILLVYAVASAAKARRVQARRQEQWFLETVQPVKIQTENRFRELSRFLPAPARSEMRVFDKAGAFRLNYWSDIVRDPKIKLRRLSRTKAEGYANEFEAEMSEWGALFDKRHFVLLDLDSVKAADVPMEGGKDLKVILIPKIFGDISNENGMRIQKSLVLFARDHKIIGYGFAANNIHEGFFSVVSVSFDILEKYRQGKNGFRTGDIYKAFLRVLYNEYHPVFFSVVPKQIYDPHDTPLFGDGKTNTLFYTKQAFRPDPPGKRAGRAVDKFYVRMMEGEKLEPRDVEAFFKTAWFEKGDYHPVTWISPMLPAIRARSAPASSKPARLRDEPDARTRSELRAEDKALEVIHDFAQIAKEKVKELAKASIALRDKISRELEHYGEIKDAKRFVRALEDLEERVVIFERYINDLVMDRDNVLGAISSGLTGSTYELFSYEYLAAKKELEAIKELFAKPGKNKTDWTTLEHYLGDLSLELLEMMDVFESMTKLPELDLRDGILDLSLNRSGLAAQVDEERYIAELKPVFQNSSNVYEEVKRLKENGTLFEIFPFLKRIAGLEKRDGSIIIDHLLNLIRFLELIGKGERAAFNEGSLGWAVEAKEFQVYQTLFEEASSGEGRELLYLTALLHNSGEISSVEDWQARESSQVRQALLKFDHSEAAGAYLIRPIIRRKLGFPFQVMKDRMKMVEWLVLNQFAAGNLLFGELSPGHLLAKMVAMPKGVDQGKLFKMLTVLSFADLRNTYQGAYVTQFKTNFYAGMMNFETLWLILQRLDEYRLQRFIADNNGYPDDQKQIALDEMLSKKIPVALRSHLKQVLKFKIHRIHFGAFLFRSVKVETLFKLLLTIAAFFKAPGLELRDVAFTTSSAEAPAAAELLDGFFAPMSFQEVEAFFTMEAYEIQAELAKRGLPVEIREGTEELVIDTKALLQLSNRSEMEGTQPRQEALPQTIKIKLDIEGFPGLQEFLKTFPAEATEGEPVRGVTQLNRPGFYEIEWDGSAGRSLDALIGRLTQFAAINPRKDLYVDYLKYMGRLSDHTLSAGNSIKLKDPLAPELEPEEDEEDIEAEEDGETDEDVSDDEETIVPEEEAVAAAEQATLKKADAASKKSGKMQTSVKEINLRMLHMIHAGSEAAQSMKEEDAEKFFEATSDLLGYFKDHQAFLKKHADRFNEAWFLQLQKSFEKYASQLDERVREVAIQEEIREISQQVLGKGGKKRGRPAQKNKGWRRFLNEATDGPRDFDALPARAKTALYKAGIYYDQQFKNSEKSGYEIMDELETMRGVGDKTKKAIFSFLKHQGRFAGDYEDPKTSRSEVRERSALDILGVQEEAVIPLDLGVDQDATFSTFQDRGDGTSGVVRVFGGDPAWFASDQGERLYQTLKEKTRVLAAYILFHLYESTKEELALHEMPDANGMPFFKNEEMKFAFILNEMVKNAIVHGHLLNLSLPVYLHWELDPVRDVFRVRTLNRVETDDGLINEIGPDRLRDRMKLSGEGKSEDVIQYMTGGNTPVLTPVEDAYMISELEIKTAGRSEMRSDANASGTRENLRTGSSKIRQSLLNHPKYGDGIRKRIANFYQQASKRGGAGITLEDLAEQINGRLWDVLRGGGYFPISRFEIKQYKKALFTEQPVEPGKESTGEAPYYQDADEIRFFLDRRLHYGLSDHSADLRVQNPILLEAVEREGYIETDWPHWALHELNNHFTSVMGNAGIIQMLIQSEWGKEYAEVLSEIEELIGQILIIMGNHVAPISEATVWEKVAGPKSEKEEKEVTRSGLGYYLDAMLSGMEAANSILSMHVLMAGEMRTSSTESLSEVLDGSLSKIPYLRHDQLGHFFLRKVFIDSPAAEANRQCYVAEIDKIKPLWKTLNQHMQKLKGKYEETYGPSDASPEAGRSEMRGNEFLKYGIPEPEARFLGLMHPDRTAFFMLLKKALDLSPGSVGVYEASFSDISSILLSTNLNEVIMVDQVPFRGSPEPRHVWEARKDDYFSIKNNSQFLNTKILETYQLHEEVEHPLLWELEAIGATDIRVNRTDLENVYRVSFAWAYPGEERRPRTITFFGGVDLLESSPQRKRLYNYYWKRREDIKVCYYKFPETISLATSFLTEGGASAGHFEMLSRILRPGTLLVSDFNLAGRLPGLFIKEKTPKPLERFFSAFPNFRYGINRTHSKEDANGFFISKLADSSTRSEPVHNSTGTARSEARTDAEAGEPLWTKPELDAKPDPMEVTKRQFQWWSKAIPAWTEEEIAKIPEVIMALYEAGINLRGGSIQDNKSEEGKRVVEGILGLPRSAGAVYAKALQIYRGKGSWSAALRDAGIDPEILSLYPGAIEERNMRLEREREEQEKSRSEMRKFRDHFKTGQAIAWHDPRQEEDLSATIRYDDIFDVYDVLPTAAMREKHREALDQLYLYAEQEDIGARGTFGLIRLDLRTLDGKPVLIFDSIHPSRGYRKITGRDRKMFRPWAETAIREMMAFAKTLGIEEFYASDESRIRKAAEIWKPGIPEASLWENYTFPFKDKGWQPSTLVLDEKQTSVWHYTARSAPVPSEPAQLRQKLDASARSEMRNPSKAILEENWDIVSKLPGLLNGYLTRLEDFVKDLHPEDPLSEDTLATVEKIKGYAKAFWGTVEQCIREIAQKIGSENDPDRKAALTELNTFLKSSFRTDLSVIDLTLANAVMANQIEGRGGLTRKKIDALNLAVASIKIRADEIIAMAQDLQEGTPPVSRSASILNESVQPRDEPDVRARSEARAPKSPEVVQQIVQAIHKFMETIDVANEHQLRSMGKLIIDNMENFDDQGALTAMRARAAILNRFSRLSIATSEIHKPGVYAQRLQVLADNVSDPMRMLDDDETVHSGDIAFLNQYVEMATVFDIESLNRFLEDMADRVEGKPDDPEEATAIRALLMMDFESDIRPMVHGRILDLQVALERGQEQKDHPADEDRHAPPFRFPSKPTTEESSSQDAGAANQEEPSSEPDTEEGIGGWLSSFTQRFKTTKNGKDPSETDNNGSSRSEARSSLRTENDSEAGAVRAEMRGEISELLDPELEANVRHRLGPIPMDTPSLILRKGNVLDKGVRQVVDSIEGTSRVKRRSSNKKEAMAAAQKLVGAYEGVIEGLARIKRALKKDRMDPRLANKTEKVDRVIGSCDLSREAAEKAIADLNKNISTWQADAGSRSETRSDASASDTSKHLEAGRSEMRDTKKVKHLGQNYRMRIEESDEEFWIHFNEMVKDGRLAGFVYFKRTGSSKTLSLGDIWTRLDLREHGVKSFFMGAATQELARRGFEITEDPRMLRSELRTEDKEATAEKIFESVFKQLIGRKAMERSELHEFIEKAVTNLDGTILELKSAFSDWLPSALAAEMSSREQGLAVSYRRLEQVLAQGELSRSDFDQKADILFSESLEILGTAIRRKQVASLAPVIFYSAPMKEKLRQFIETVQAGFEATGDVTAEQYRITLVSQNKPELLNFVSELSKAGLSRGVQHHVVDGTQAGWERLAKQLSSSVTQHPVFGERFGVFFPDAALAEKIPAWQRVVRAEVPEEYAILLLPALSSYFATVTTSEINATTLRHALPDLFASAAFRVGRGIAIVAAFLERIARADRQISTSA